MVGSSGRGCRLPLGRRCGNHAASCPGLWGVCTGAGLEGQSCSCWVSSFPPRPEIPRGRLEALLQGGAGKRAPFLLPPQASLPPPPPPVEGLRLIAPEIHTRRENIRKSEQVEGVTYSPSLPRQPHALARAQFTPGLAVTSSARRRGHPACRDGCGELGKSLAFQLERLSWDFRPCHPCHDLAHL